MTDSRQNRPEPLIPTSGRVYGTDLRGDLPAGFAPYLHPPSGAARPVLELRFGELCEPPDEVPVWVADPTPRSAERLTLIRSAGGFVLTVECDGQGLFRVSPGEIAIDWLAGGAPAEHYFFSFALPLWLEFTGVPVLHASAVALGDRVVAFVGQSGVGKSTLCAELAAAGCAFVADDGLPLRRAAAGTWEGAPGPPWLRLWPSALEKVLRLPASRLPTVPGSGDKRRLPAPAGGGRAGRSLPLAAVYVLLDRTADGLEIEPCSPRQGLVHLLEHSLAAGPAAALELSAKRMDALADVALRVPVRRLRLPTGGLAATSVMESLGADAGAA